MSDTEEYSILVAMKHLINTLEVWIEIGTPALFAKIVTTRLFAYEKRLTGRNEAGRLKDENQIYGEEVGWGRIDENILVRERKSWMERVSGETSWVNRRFGYG